MPVVRSHSPRAEQYSYSLRFVVRPPESLNAHVGGARESMRGYQQWSCTHAPASERTAAATFEITATVITLTAAGDLVATTGHAAKEMKAMTGTLIETLERRCNCSQHLVELCTQLHADLISALLRSRLQGGLGGLKQIKEYAPLLLPGGQESILGHYALREEAELSSSAGWKWHTVMGGAALQQRLLTRLVEFHYEEQICYGSGALKKTPEQMAAQRKLEQESRRRDRERGSL